MRGRFWSFIVASLLLAPLWGVGAELADATPSAQPWPPERNLRLPVNIVRHGTLLESHLERPLITLGRPPDDVVAYSSSTLEEIPPRNTAQWFFVHDNESDSIRDLALGKIPFTGPGGNLTTMVLLVTPPIDWRNHWIPADISLSGNTITLRILAWDGAVTPPQTVGGSRHELFLLDLGYLAAGTYDFVVSCQHLQQEEPPSGGLPDGPYKWSGRSDTARLTFTVGAKTGGAPPTLASSALQTKQAQLLPSEWSERPPVSWSFQSHLELGNPGPPALHVGSFDAPKYATDLLLDDHPHEFPLPVLKVPPEPGKEVYAVVNGPVLNSREWMALERVEYRPGECRLTVGVWRSSGAWWKNVRYVPFLIVPLHLTPGETKVSLVWRNYQSAGNLTETLAEREPSMFEKEFPDPASPVKVTVSAK